MPGLRLLVEPVAEKIVGNEAGASFRVPHDGELRCPRVVWHDAGEIVFGQNLHQEVFLGKTEK
jgi:hypothetical protein